LIDKISAKPINPDISSLIGRIMSGITPDNIYGIYQEFKSPLAVMVGAGLSAPLPTGLPLQRDILISLLNLDWVDGEEKFPIKNEKRLTNTIKSILHSKKSMVDAINDKLRLEHILSIYSEWGNRDVGVLLTQFGDAKPNWYHYQIAGLASQRIICNILTTNFDLCLEKALDSLGVPYIQVTDEDGYKKAEKSNKLKLIKLHGTLCPSGSNETSKGLISTLESMSQGIDQWKANCLRQNIDDHGLILLGYSGRDSFDINPVLREKSDQRLIWVLRKPSSMNTEIEHNLLFSRYKDPIIADPTTFLGETRTLDPPLEGSFKFNHVYSLKDLWHPSVFLGRILEAAQQYNAALEYYKLVLKKSKHENYWTFQIIDIIRSLAVCNYELKKYSLALEILKNCGDMIDQYEKYLRTNSRIPINIEKKIILDQKILLSDEKCLVYGQLNRKEQLVDEEKNLFNLLEEYEHSFGGDHKTRSRVLLNNATSTIGRVASKEELNVIIKNLEYSLELKKNIGDIIGYAMDLSLLALAKTKYGDIDNIEPILLEFFAVNRKLGEKRESISPDASKFPLISLCTIYYFKLNLGYSPVNQYLRYQDLDKSSQRKFSNRLEKLLDSSPIESICEGKFILVLEDDSEIQQILADKRADAFGKEPSFSPLIKEYSEVAKEYGITVLTPESKIGQYHTALRDFSLRDNPTKNLTVSHLWLTIGEQYHKAGDHLQAHASYQRALHIAEALPASIWPENQKKESYIEELYNLLAALGRDLL